MLAAIRAAWSAAEVKLGSGADHTAIIKWLERLEPAPAPPPIDQRDATKAETNA
jgi:hypothetical protein